MTFFEAFPWIDDPVFVMYLFSFGVVLRFGFYWADFWIVTIKDFFHWLRSRLKKTAD